jgi:PAS domain S-box-containing protein
VQPTATTTARPEVPSVRSAEPTPVVAPVGLERILNSILDAVIGVNAAGDIVLANRATESIFGYRPEELLGRPIEVLVPLELRPAHRAHRTRYLDRPVSRAMGTDLELTAVRRDGARIPVDISMTTMGGDPAPITTVVVRDLTADREREAARRALARSERHLTLSQEIARLGSWEEDRRTGLTHWSAELHRMLQVAPGTVVPSVGAFCDQVDPDDALTVRHEFERAQLEGGPILVQARVHGRVLAVRGMVELDADGRAERTVGAVLDVTESDQFQRDLRAGEERLRVAFDHAPIGMALVNARPPSVGRFLRVNHALTELYGVHEHELLGRSTRDFLEASELADSDRLLAEFASGELTQLRGVERVITRPDGVLVTSSISASLVRDGRGDPDHFILQVLDISAQRQAEQADRDREQRDHRIAGVLQDSLLPFVPSRVGPARVATRYQPAGRGEVVGGDWHDVFALPDGQLGVVVGDVAGHGIESAVIMSRLRYAARMLATSGASPAGVMRRLNDVMHADDQTDAGATLATLVHAQINPRTGIVRYSSAGHLPMITVTPTGATAAPVALPVPALGGPPIGVVPDYRYSDHEVALEPGSVLIGFTDGLIERRGQSLDDALLALLLGIGGLPDAVCMDVERLADAVLSLAPPGEHSDDTAVIVLALDGAAHWGDDAHGRTSAPGAAISGAGRWTYPDPG